MKLAQHYRTLGLRRGASFSDVKRAYRRIVRQCHPDINPGEAAIERFIQINAAYTALCETLQQEVDTETKADGYGVGAGVGATDTETGAYRAKQPSERLNLRDLKRTLEKLGLGNFQQDAESAGTKTTQTPAPSETPVPSETVTGSANNSTQAASARATTEPSTENVHPETIEVAPSTSAEDIGLKQEAYNQLRDLLRQQKFPRAIALVEGLAHRLPTDTEINQWQAIVYQRWGRQLISQGQFHKAHLYLKKALQTDPNNPSLSNEVARDLGLLKHIQAAEATLSQP